jgi:hypothetical protein
MHDEIFGYSVSFKGIPALGRQILPSRETGKFLKSGKSFPEWISYG